MILLIDAGNTRIKWALVESGAALGAWSAAGAVPHAELGQLPAAWNAALAGRHIHRALLANVAGAALRAQLQLILPPTLPAPAVLWFASVAQLAGLRNGYRNPAQLGCDRFAAAIAAHALAPGRAVIVANCGTATTIDAVTADGVFLGGMILPGLALMASSLARNTAQLPQIAQDAKLPAGFADNTDDAILSGCLAAQGGAIEHAVALHRASDCIISGGAAPFIAPTLKVAHRVVDNVVLIGLHAAAGSA
ncbi:type III pantothenate kinase [Rugamonas sp. CCM 8940]|uniref:type III pantothenate kinase n=1 Tax=Rugamonas sp. CCM 8940 TaxID=2765359 RepID=UPI0018F50476|nr:type III pantothenate kinase [Rugamonas sp. CCM 8940]MBJ7314210.1 type III pantothenate kinase [Rugamonas sp. CCM 8940]